MTNATSTTLGEKLVHLRRAFDRGFAESPPHADVLTDFLAIRVGTDPYAVRLDDVAGIFADRKITPLPASVSGLLGMAGLRGGVVPVYDLGGLIGYPERDVPPRWLVLIAGRSAALAFDTFDRHLRLPPLDATVDIHADSTRLHVRGAVRDGDLLRPVLHMPSMLAVLERQVRTT